MAQVNIHEAKTHLSRWVDAVESGAESEVVIARNGRPAVRIVALEKPKQQLRIGLFKGKYEIPDDIDSGYQEEVARLFYGESDV